MATSRKDREEEAARAQRDVARMNQQAEKLLGPGETGTPQEDEEDFAEIWGKRIGRGLGICFAIFLLVYLMNEYVF